MNDEDERGELKVCADCGARWLLWEHEIAFLRSLGYDTTPRRCHPCRRLRRTFRGTGAHAHERTGDSVI